MTLNCLHRDFCNDNIAVARWLIVSSDLEVVV